DSQSGLTWSFMLPFTFNAAGTNYLGLTYSGQNVELVSTKYDNVQLYSTDINENDRTPSNQTTSISPVGYKVEGANGNRIVKLQFKNVGSTIEFASNNTTNVYTNVQIWLYENGNVIEYRIGDNNVNNYATLVESPMMFAISREEGDAFISILYGSHTNTQYAEYTDPDQITPATYGMTNYPANGTVYRFAPTTSANVNDNFFDNVKVYPNPTADKITFENLKQTNNYSIYNTVGQLILSGRVDEHNNTIDVSNYTNGLYILQIDQSTFKFVKE